MSESSEPKAATAITPAPVPERPLTETMTVADYARHIGRLGGRPKGRKSFRVSREMHALFAEIENSVPKKGSRKPADLVILLQCELMKQAKQPTDLQDGINLLARVWKLFNVERTVKEKDTSDKDLKEVELDYRKLAGGAINGARRMSAKKSRPDDDDD